MVGASAFFIAEEAVITAQNDGLTTNDFKKIQKQFAGAAVAPTFSQMMQASGLLCDENSNRA
jgi:hypothetical protein